MRARHADPAVVIPGAYQRLLAHEQREHDRPDPRMYIGVTDDPLELARLEAEAIEQATASPPSELMAALRAGDPVIVAAGSLRGPLPRELADVEWLRCTAMSGSD